MCGVFGYGGFEVPKYNTFIEDKNGERIDFILDVAKRSRLNMGIRDGTLISACALRLCKAAA